MVFVDDISIVNGLINQLITGGAPSCISYVVKPPTILIVGLSEKKAPHFIHWFIIVSINVVILGLSPHLRQIQAQEPGWSPLRLSKTCHVFVEYKFRWFQHHVPYIPIKKNMSKLCSEIILFFSTNRMRDS